MFCIHCGAQLPDNARFCHACGQAQGGPDQPPQQPQQVSQQPRQAFQPAPSAAPIQAPVQTITAAAQGAAAVAGAAKKGLSGAKLLLILLALAALAGGGYWWYENSRDPADGIRETVMNFQEAYNTQDVYGMLDCFDPAYTAIYQGALSLVGDLAGFDLASAMDGLAGLAAVLPAEAMGVDYPYLDIQVTSIDLLSENSASVGMVFYVSGMENVEPMPVTTSMVQIDHTWYFSGEGFFW